MAAVLHLHEKSCDYQTRTAVAQIIRLIPDSTRMTLGRGGDFSTSLSAALRFRAHARNPDLIHAWGARALMIAAITPAARRIIYSPTTFPSRNDVGLIRAICAARDVHVVCPTDTMRRAFVERGISIQRCHLIRPGVDFATAQRRRDNTLRDRLGFSADDKVILAVGESTRAANHHDTLLVGSVLYEYDAKYRTLLWGTGPMADSEAAFQLRLLSQRSLSTATEKLGPDITFEQLLSAADIALITAKGPAEILPVAVCMAAALPIVSVVSPTASELLEDRYNCLMVGLHRARLIARRVLDLADDPQLAWQIADAARTDAYRLYPLTQFIQQYRTLYRQIAANQPVDLHIEAGGHLSPAGR